MDKRRVRTRVGRRGTMMYPRVASQAAPSSMHDTRWVGKYLLVAQLGRGGTADVFLAALRGPGGFNKIVVLKQIRPEYADEPEFRRLIANASDGDAFATNVG